MASPLLQDLFAVDTQTGTVTPLTAGEQGQGEGPARPGEGPELKHTGLQQRSRPLCASPAASTDSFEDPTSAGPSASQQTASPPLPALPTPRVLALLSTAPTWLLKPTQVSLARIGQNHPPHSSNLRQRHLCFSSAQEKPWVGSFIFLLPRPDDPAPKMFFESSTCPGCTHPSTKLPKCCSQTVSSYSPRLRNFTLLGPHCLESAPHPRPHSPGPSCHLADYSHQRVGGCTMGSGVSPDLAVTGHSYWMDGLRRRLSRSCVQLAVIGCDISLWASLCCSGRKGHLALKSPVWQFWLCIWRRGVWK